MLISEWLSFTETPTWNRHAGLTYKSTCNPATCHLFILRKFPLPSLGMLQNFKKITNIQKKWKWVGFPGPVWIKNRKLENLKKKKIFDDYWFSKKIDMGEGCGFGELYPIFFMNVWNFFSFARPLSRYVYESGLKPHSGNIPRKQETLTRCCFNVGSPSATLAQH